jgi:hypothetical protein
MSLPVANRSGGAGAATIRRDSMDEVSQLQRLAQTGLAGHRRQYPPSGPCGVRSGVEEHGRL